MNGSAETARQQVINRVAKRIRDEFERYNGEFIEEYLVQRLAYSSIHEILDEDLETLRSLFKNGNGDG